MAKNKVIAGKYQGCIVVGSGNSAIIGTGFMKTLNLDHTVVKNYELITDEHRKSASSGATRGIVGGVLLGPVGMLAGTLSAKSRGTYVIAVEYFDGNKSLIEADEKFYKALAISCFNSAPIILENQEENNETSNIYTNKTNTTISSDIQNTADVTKEKKKTNIWLVNLFLFIVFVLIMMFTM